MKRLILILPVLAVATTGCEKAKNLADKASSAVKQQLDKSTGKSDASGVDWHLGKLVEQTSEGAVFRKDLPFPDRLEVLVTTQRELTCRIYQKSEIERKSEEIKGTQVHIAKLERTGNHVRHTLQQASFVKFSPDQGETGGVMDDPFRQSATDRSRWTLCSRTGSGRWARREVSGRRR